MTTLDLGDFAFITFIVVLINVVCMIGFKLYMDNMMSEVIDFLQKRLQTFRATLTKTGKKIEREPQSIDWVNTGIDGIKTILQMKKQGLTAKEIVSEMLEIQDVLGGGEDTPE